MKTVPLVLFLLFLLMAVPALAEVTIIANSGVPGTTISRNDLKDIFLGKLVKWSDNSRVNIVLASDAALNESFLTNYVGRSPAQYNMHWRNLVFTGQGQMPLSLKSDQEIIHFVAATPGAVGYISGQAEVNTIKKLNVQ